MTSMNRRGTSISAKVGTLNMPIPKIDSKPPCADDPNLFFPDSYMIEPYLAAKEVCARCPSAEKCREFAIENKIEEGVWGGTTPHERGYWFSGAPRKKDDFKRYINLDKFFTARQLCEFLKINQVTLGRLIKAGVCPPPKLHLIGVYYWAKDEINPEEIIVGRYL